MKYKIRPVTVDAVQWNQPGDSSLVKTPNEAQLEGWWTPEEGVTYDPQTQGVVLTVDGPVVIAVGTWVIDDAGDVTVRPTEDFEKLFSPLKGHKPPLPQEP